MLPFCRERLFQEGRYVMDYTYSVCSKCNGLNKVQSQTALKQKPVCGKCQSELPMHGLVSDARTSDFERILAKSEKPVLVDFWASWCGPCKMYGPEFEKASKENTSAVFLKVNTEEEQMLANKLGIRGIPCTILLQNGREIKRQSGVMNTSQLKQFLS